MRYRLTFDLTVMGNGRVTLEADSPEQAIEKLQDLGPYDFDEDPTWTSVVTIDAEPDEVEEMD